MFKAEAIQITIERNKDLIWNKNNSSTSLKFQIQFFWTKKWL